MLLVGNDKEEGKCEIESSSVRQRAFSLSLSLTHSLSYSVSLGSDVGLTGPKINKRKVMCVGLVWLRMPEERELSPHSAHSELRDSTAALSPTSCLHGWISSSKLPTISQPVPATLSYVLAFSPSPCSL